MHEASGPLTSARKVRYLVGFSVDATSIDGTQSMAYIESAGYWMRGSPLILDRFASGYVPKCAAAPQSLTTARLVPAIP